MYIIVSSSFDLIKLYNYYYGEGFMSFGDGVPLYELEFSTREYASNIFLKEDYRKEDRVYLKVYKRIPEHDLDKKSRNIMSAHTLGARTNDDRRTLVSVQLLFENQESVIIKGNKINTYKIVDNKVREEYYHYGDFMSNTNVPSYFYMKLDRDVMDGVGVELSGIIDLSLETFKYHMTHGSLLSVTFLYNNNGEYESVEYNLPYIEEVEYGPNLLYKYNINEYLEFTVTTMEG